MNLESLGFSPVLNFHLDEIGDPELVPGRLARVERGRGLAFTREHLVDVVWTPPLDVVDAPPVEGPAVGDWCALTPDGDLRRVVSLLPRHTCFARGKAAGARAAQVIAANLDLVFVVTGLDGDFSLRRIERYLTLARESGARPAVVLNKSDLCGDAEARRQEAEAVAPGVEVLLASARLDTGLDELRAALAPGRTGAFLGSSGVGKSTMINRLLGEERLATQEVRAFDDRGRHTTTHRELIPLPGGGAVIDTPGLREVGLLGDEAALAQVFEEVSAVAADCRFADCRHEGEPGCAVQVALERGELSQERVGSFLHLRLELENAERRRSSYEQRSHERQTVGKYKGWMRDLRKIRGH